MTDMADRDVISKAEVLDIYAELYDEFDDAPGIIKVLHRVYDKINNLKEQEPIEPKRTVDEHGQVLSCGNCGAWFEIQFQKYCHECGRAVKWDAAD